MSQIIENFEKTLLQYEPTRRKTEPEIMSEILVSREGLSETLVSEENTLSETTLIESALSGNTMVSELVLLEKPQVTSSPDRSPTVSPRSASFTVALQQMTTQIQAFQRQMAEMLGKNERNNIFHSRCLVQGRVCLLVIDGGSRANLVSSRLVSKLNLVALQHPTPYRLQGSSEIIVNRQVSFIFKHKLVSFLSILSHYEA
ncbi:hypothetical protein Lal_00011188 [Lupinus albus]|nr:hypothetical protein Lal_00011188 [Lupinus albus]